MTETNLILAVETSSRVGSVAIAHGDKLLGETVFSAPLKHSAELFPAINELLDRHGHEPGQIEHIYISGGPGSFTGLRISAAFAKTMHLANAAEIVSVDTLDAVAANVINFSEENTRPAHERIAVIVDAKRGQFFIAAYERSAPGGVWTKVLPDCLMTTSQFLARFAGKDNPICLLGDGLVYYQDKFKAEGVSFFDEDYWSPRAAKIHLLGRQKAIRGEFADPLTLTPNYLRRPDAKVKPS
ncbi:MAG: tRNA (adenosine(37)-N6)-threonylcarbamoyltransferase complex dimerization subunit type 1 TsaB [Planctomycetota bacterium]|nr:tRNA (adenosine(37)-N6)-threonylcarbamoyltransferase complex dimerization subunit type 1 TsaB [Planctomycetota bacterium]